MGLYDREYMREVPEYLRITGRAAEGGACAPPFEPGHRRGYLPSGPTPRTRSRRRSSAPWVWTLLGAAIVAYLVIGGVVGRFASHDGAAYPASPTPASVFTSIRRLRRVNQIGGTRLLRFGSRFTLTGHAAPAAGFVRVRGRWNRGHWQTFAVANANGQPYSFSFPVNHRGILRLRVVQPNGYLSVGTYHIS